MPEFKYDVTDRALDYMASMIEPMPGNEGQRYLTELMVDEADAECIVIVSIDGLTVDVDVDYDISLTSNHPEAIEDIMAAAEGYFQEYAENASDIEGLVDIAFGDMVG